MCDMDDEDEEEADEEFLVLLRDKSSKCTVFSCVRRLWSWV